MQRLGATELLVILFLVWANPAESDDFNWWTLWWRNDAGSWTPSALSMGGRDCVARLDLVEHLYDGAERPSKTVVLIPTGAATRSPLAKRLARERFPDGPPVELRCLPYTADPRGPKARQ
jgi:hypothetical protein